MSCLNATFTLTPRSPWWGAYLSPQAQSFLYCYGADFLLMSPYDFTSLYSANALYFDSSTAADPNVDYAQWANRRRAPFLELYVNLTGPGKAKQLALIFGFGIPTGGLSGRVQVYNDAGLISDQTLASSDSQFLLEIESLDNEFRLYFVHVGGSWFFNGLSGYLV
jgi:hypothetical protein